MIENPTCRTCANRDGTRCELWKKNISLGDSCYDWEWDHINGEEDKKNLS